MFSEHNLTFARKSRTINCNTCYKRVLWIWVSLFFQLCSLVCVHFSWNESIIFFLKLGSLGPCWVVHERALVFGENSVQTKMTKNGKRQPQNGIFHLFGKKLVTIIFNRWKLTLMPLSYLKNLMSGKILVLELEYEMLSTI